MVLLLFREVMRGAQKLRLDGNCMPAHKIGRGMGRSVMRCPVRMAFSRRTGDKNQKHQRNENLQAAERHRSRFSDLSVEFKAYIIPMGAQRACPQRQKSKKAGISRPFRVQYA